MAKRGKNTQNNPENAPRSQAIAARGVRTGADFAGLMSALMSDLIEGRIDGRTGNAVCNASGKLLKVVEMQHKYGTGKGDVALGRVLELVPLVSGESESVQ